MKPQLPHVNQDYVLWTLNRDGWRIEVQGPVWACLHEARRWEPGMAEVRRARGAGKGAAK